MRPVLSVCSVAVLVVFLTVGIRSTLVLLHIRPVINGRVSAATHVVAAPHSVNNVQSVGFRGSVLNVQLAAARTWPFQQAQEPALQPPLRTGNRGWSEVAILIVGGLGCCFLAVSGAATGGKVGMRPATKRIAAASNLDVDAISADVRTSLPRSRPIKALLPVLGGLSKLAGTQWELNLSFGQEPGSYMARSGWGGSGNRIRVKVVVEFADEPAQESEELVGPQSQTRILKVVECGSFVGFDGEKVVSFTNGGWCVQRAIFLSSRDPGSLRFWLDCDSGATKGDVAITAGERIFFTASVLDDSDAIARSVRRRAEAEEALQELAAKRAARVERRQAAIDAQRQGVARPPDEEPFWERIPGVSFRKQIIEQEKRQNWERELAGYKSFPDLGQGPAAIGTAAPDGSLSVKRQREAVKNADNVYHVVGRFETSYLQVGSKIGYD